MKLKLTARALAEAKRKKSWWLENRPRAPDLFEQELVAALDAIVAMPSVGTEYSKTRNHVYFAADGDEVVILSVWGAERARGPKL